MQASRILHAMLLDKQSELHKTIGLGREEVEVDGTIADPLDKALAQSARETAVAGVRRAVKQLREVATALNKIGHGDYGLCEGCDEEIPEVRLLAVPWAKYCVQCQEKKEK